MYLLAPLIVQNLKKKIHSTDSEIWRYAIFAPKMAHLPRKRIFFRKSVNTHCSFHSCISTFEKSKLNVNPLLKYEGSIFTHKMTHFPQTRTFSMFMYLLVHYETFLQNP